MITKSLDTLVQYLKGIGPKRAQALRKLGIVSLEDLFYYFPRRYEDRTQFSSIARLKENEPVTVKAQVLARGARQSFWRQGFSIVEIVVGDETGKISCVWFNQPYLKDYFHVGDTVILYGQAKRYENNLQINSPQFEVITEEGSASLDIGRIVPVYALPEGFTQRYFRRIIKRLIDEYLIAVNDFLPYNVRFRQGLVNLAKALTDIHFPDNFAVQAQAYRRLAFEEFLLFQIPLALRKRQRQQKSGISHRIEGGLIQDFIAGLDFRLTSAQERVIAEIKRDMASTQPMQRLLQGDVGAGKTVVATVVSLIAIQGGFQVAFMVPTEILARQHYINVKNQISKIKDKSINVGLLISSINKKEKEELYKGIREGKVDLLIGTHAVLEEEVGFKNLGLVVIDEQHKFGVGQRALLPAKGANPDVLIMTATPIPRTLAITLYGDLDVSVITELPPGRLPVKTLRFSEKEASEAYALAKEHLRQGKQVYIVYPVIEESYALDMAGAQQMYEQLKDDEFKEFKLGLIHGRLKQNEQDRIMREFYRSELDVLLATTVLEVGIDVPNATCMIIEHAERFGLAQLHQLRGRVGRAGFASLCILVSDQASAESKARLEAMLTYHDGFRIAEEDLKIRGPGEFFGNRQHGLSELKIANPLTQMQLLKSARQEALSLTGRDPRLETRQNILLKAKLLQRFPQYEKLVMVG